MQLNKEQQKAVDTTDGPLLIIAGAGSGKTRVITERLAKIIDLGLARPEDMLVVTFTNKAAGEIKERVRERLKSSQSLYFPWLGTFHSIAVKILRAHGYKIGIDKNFSIYDGKDQLSVIKNVMKTLGLSTQKINPRAMLSGISNAKQKLLTPKKFAKDVEGYFEENIAMVYLAYQKYLRENMALDFDDLLMEVVNLLQEDSETRDYYQKKFRYTMVDEYQDTNHAQYLIVKILSDHYKNICVVGDDDQSIYGWRGANIKNILEFEKDFEKVTVVKLEQNYRSTQKILDAGASLVEPLGNKRKSKRLWTDKSSGDNLHIYQAIDEKDESYWVAEKITTLINNSTNPEEIAILYRMNAQSRIIEESMIKSQIPYRIIGNVRFYDRKEIKDMLAYLRIIYNPEDQLSLLRIINVPARKIGAKTISKLLEYSSQTDKNPIEFLLNQEGILAGGLLKFSKIIKKIFSKGKDLDIVSLLEYILEVSEYRQYLEDGTEEGAQRFENVKELINVAQKYSDLEPDAGLQAFLEDIALSESQAEIDEKSMEVIDNRVTMMTTHSAKGLEYSHVFIIGMEEGIMPHSRSIDNISQLDEERRLAYVAVTRAKTNIYITYANSRMVFGSRSSTSPSRFLNDIDPEIIDFESWNSSTNSGEFNNDINNYYSSDSEELYFNFKVGDKVRHPHFGIGKIETLNNEYVTVKFNRHGRKELAIEFANLSNI